MHMVKLFKYRNGKVKVTWDEQPMLPAYEYEWRYEEIKTNTYKTLESFFIGAEVMIHTGGRMCYGMLAAKVQPHDDKDIVKVAIAVTHENVIHYEGSLLLNDIYVYEGLPEEYINQIKSSIIKTVLEKEKYPQCVISFENAANCEVGSSPMLFGMIAELIVDLICTSSKEDVLNMNIEDFTKQYIKHGLLKMPF